MRTRILLCTGIVLCLVGTLQATTWSGPSGGKWSDPVNWGGIMPSPTEKAFVRQLGACIVDYPEAEAYQIDCAGGPIQIVDGGVLRTYSWFILGYGVGDIGEMAGRLEVYDGGVLNCNVRLFVGFQGEGYLTVYEGGTVNIIDERLGVGEHVGGTGTGFVELEGGSINLLEATDAEGLSRLYTGGASINFRGGTMTLRDTTENNDTLAMATGDGIIKAYDGVGEVVVDPCETIGRLTIRGLHPLKPSPRDDGLIKPGAVDLSWVLPDPCQPGTPVTVDVYFGTSADVGSAECPKVIDQQSVTSVSVNLEAKKRYYWAIDTYIGSPADPVWGPVFSFYVDNLPPVVDAGADLVTWLEDGTRTSNLDATATDQDALTVQWTVVSEPSAVIDIQITDGGDDVEQHVASGNMDLNSSDLEIAYEDAGDPATDEQVVGLRFVDVPLENGAPVADAWVEVEVDKVNKQGSQAPVNLIIEGELAPDAAPFANDANNVTDRAVTTAKVKWSIPAWTEQNAKFQSPNISSIIMEINSQRFWAPGNAIVLILRDDKDNPSTGLREAESRNGEAAAAPLLRINLAGEPVVIETPTAEDTNVTLSTLGEHVLQLDAFDGELTTSDTVAINVYRDGCEAAKSMPDYVTLVGDLNGDCVVDDADMTLLQENWLQENSLIEEIRLD